MAYLPPPPPEEVQVVSRSKAGTPPRLDADIIASIQESGLNIDHARLMGLRLATEAELAAMSRKPAKVMAIPYFDLNGNQTDFTRYRYLADPRSAWERWVLQRKALRYFQPAGTTVHAYFPPLLDWAAVAAKVDQHVLITEGEKKAASATALGIPTVGLGGVDCFVARGDDTPLLPELMEMKWEGRPVTVVYDSDASTNPHVLAASVKLARRLMALGAQVAIAELPPTKDGKKQGLDDFIVNTLNQGGSPREAVAAIVAAADQTLLERELALYDMNRQFVYIRDMDRVLVRADGVMLQPDPFVKRAYASLKHREWKVTESKDGKITRVPEIKPTAQVWMHWENRLTVKTLVFDPSLPEFTGGNYNLWRGWNVQPKEGDPAPWHDLLQHLFSNATVAEKRWFEQWVAYPIQNPGAKLKTACLIWSREEGSGKSTILETLRMIYGDLYAAMNDSAVELKYTDWLVNKLFVGVDDISARNRDDHGAKWKNLITSPRVTVEKKFIPSFEVDSRVNFLMTSNEPNALRISNQDRRYFIHESCAWGTPDDRIKFFDRYYEWLHNGGAEILLGYLLTVPMDGFNPDAPAPMTEAKREMIDMSGGHLEAWIQDLLDAPDAMLCNGQVAVPGDLFTAEDIQALYNGRNAGQRQIASMVTMAAALRNKQVPRAAGGRPVRLTDGRKVRLYAFRRVEEWVAAEPWRAAVHYCETRGIKGRKGGKA